MARPWQQRGTAPSLPVTGSATWADSIVYNLGTNVVGSNNIGVSGAVNDPRIYAANPNHRANMIGALNSNTIAATSVNVADLRVAIQLQRWMELNARAGVRPDEFLQAHFGVSPRDERLQEPEYIGGMKAPIIVSEVLQTSQTDTSPQGNMAGHGIGVSQGYIGKYRVLEHGWILS